MATIKKLTNDDNGINDGDEEERAIPTEEYPFFGRRPQSRCGCKLTMCLTFLVLCAAAGVVIVSVWIANREQISAELLLDVESVAADFAFWDPRKQVLYWVDRQLLQIHMYDPVLNTIAEMQFNHSLGVVMPRMSYNDSVIITSGKFMSSLNLTTGIEQIMAYMSNGTDDATQFTDGRCDPNGGLWAGSSVQDGFPTGTLYRIDPTQTVSVMLHNVTTPGGMAWSKDRKSFFFIDSMNSRVNLYSYDSATGTITFERVAFIVPSSYGTLSGMTIDSTDSLWIAIIGPKSMNGTGRVCRYDAYLGQLQETIMLPVSGVTSCVFGGPLLDQLYITTRLKPGEMHSGGIYVANRLGVTGAYPSMYAG